MIFEECGFLAGVKAYELESVNIVRKYISFFELVLSYVTSHLIFISSWSEVAKAQVSGGSFVVFCGWRLGYFNEVFDVIGALIVSFRCVATMKSN